MAPSWLLDTKCEVLMYVRRSIILIVALGSFGGLVASTTACSSSSSPSSLTNGPSPDVTVTIAGNLGAQSFTPSPVAMRVGQTVSWKNNDAITHDATQNGSGFTTGNIAGGATSSPIMMSTAGTFTYHCAIHPGMVGTITVQ
jgi:plastocyanin